MRWLRVAWKTLPPPKSLHRPNTAAGVVIYLSTVENTIFPCRPDSAHSEGSCKMQDCFFKHLNGDAAWAGIQVSSPGLFLVRQERPFTFRTSSQSTSGEQKPLAEFQSLEGDCWQIWTPGKTSVLRSALQPGGKASAQHCSVTSVHCGDHLLHICPSSNRVGFTGAHLVWQKVKESLEFTSQQCESLPHSASSGASSSHD